ncbi:MAG: DUF4411 family protein [Verrucomicrobiia bacterium]
MAYLLDADVFIQAKNLHYRFDVVPGFWQWLDSANSAGKVMSIKAVRKELLERSDKLSLWCKSRKKMFVDTEDGKTYESLQLLATWVSERYEPAAQTKFFGDADFRLVGFAHAHNHTVVTHEIPGYGYDVKIPNACKQMDVPIISPFEMLTVEKVRLDLRV